MTVRKKKFFIITTVPMSLIFFKGQLLALNKEFAITLISSPEPELLETAILNNVKSYGLAMKREISLLDDIISLLKLIIYFFKQRPDVVHGNTPKGSFLSMVASWFCRIPVRIYYVHGLRYQGTQGAKKSLLMWMEKISCFFATDIIAVSNGVKLLLLQDKITQKPITVIWNGSVNGIDLETFDADHSEIVDVRSKYGIDQTDFLFGFLGRMTGDKGINELVYAFAKISKNNLNVKLLLVGPYENNLDPLKQETLEEIHSNKSIISTGAQKDVRSFLKAMDMFVFPSYREGFGIVLMEAAAMNVPSISSDIIGCNEIISDSVNGFLISPKDENALLEKMKYCLNNRGLINSMSIKVREIISRKYEQKQLWDKTIEYYRTISSK